MTEFNQNAWLKTYIDMTREPRKKNDFEKDFFKLINNAVFGKANENVRKHRNIILFTTKRRRSYLVSRANYHITKFLTEDLLAIEMEKTKKQKQKQNACLTCLFRNFNARIN